MSSRHTIRARILPDGVAQTIVGRDAWALEQLLSAGERGCTPIDRPAPRWSHYVWKLRVKHGIIIETIDEPHGGAYAGHHARYVLRSEIEVCRECSRLIAVLAARTARRIIGQTTLLATRPEELEGFVLEEVERLRADGKAYGADVRDVSLMADAYHSEIVRECARLAKLMHHEGGRA